MGMVSFAANPVPATKTIKGSGNPWDCWGLVHVKPACIDRQCRSFVPTRPFRSYTIRRGADMSHVYRLDDAVRHHTQGPQGRLQSEESRVYTVVRCLPIETDGRLRYRIKSDKIERVVTEDELSYFQ